MTPGRTPFDRDAALARMADERFDVVVVGGGITGAGVALDAAARGLRCALVERHDFASGTSSRSSKLVHGGLRYLQQREYRLVYENLAERHRLLRNAPHLVTVQPFVIPLFGRGDRVVDRTVARAYQSALWAYDLTGGLRIGHRHRRIRPDEVVAHMPTLRPDRVAAGFVYYDARADDARLTLTIARTAVLDHGAVAANHAEVTRLLRDGGGGGGGGGDGGDGDDGGGGRVTGVVLADGREVRAGVVVNATGVWADRLQALEHDDHTRPPSLRPAKGVHLVVPRNALPCDLAMVLPVPHDKRSIFVVPWGDHVYLGTTDTHYEGSLDDPQCSGEDVRYLLGAVNAVVTRPLTEVDVVGSWAGLRPLVRDERRHRTADLSRRHRVVASEGGMVTVTGGKLTTYRKMAQDTVDEVARRLDRQVPRSPTATLPLRGARGLDELGQPGAADRLGVAGPTLDHLVARYGVDARTVAGMLAADPSLAEPLVPGLPYLRAEAVYGARYEMARTLDDVLSRRTRARALAAEATAAAALDVALLLAPELGWDGERARREAAAFRRAVRRERAAAGLAPAAAAGTGRGGRG